MRVLIVASRYPYPPWRGNQVRTVEWLAALGESQRMLVCPEPAPSDDRGALEETDIEIRHYGSGVMGRAAGLVASTGLGRPVQEGLYSTRSAGETVDRLVREHPPDVAIVQMVRCGWAVDAVQRASPDSAIVFDAIDAMGLHFDRAARFVHPVLRPVYGMEATRCGRRERELAARAHVTTAVSARDLAALDPTVGRVVPVAGREVQVGSREEVDPCILLSGNLGYRPTVQGALWFAREVWPRVRRRVPKARWILAGARPTAAIRRLRDLDGVEVHADVPDLAIFQRAAAVSIAPMAEGSGVPMKVLEAWAAGVPVVAHPWTAGGLEESSRDAVVVAEDAREWCDAVAKLLTDKVAAQRLASRGLEAWDRSYRADRVAELVREVVLEATRGGR